MTYVARHEVTPASDSASGTPPGLGDEVLHLLVVDDEDAVRRYAARILEREGFTIHQAGDGVQACELVQQGTVSFELVLSDIIMPRLNGVELLKALAVTHPHIPVILMSAYAQEELAQMGVAMPCGVIPKPFPAERLVHEVRRCIRKRE
jgi:two-component system cell cycle sensor histidine kinase/response regulator CckA